MWCPDWMGGGRCGGGARCGGSVGYIWIHFCIGEYIFCIGGMFEKNFLKFSQIFTFLSGVPDAAGLSDTFLVLEILVEKKFSQIFSNFLGIHFYVLAIAENFLKFSQKFFNFSSFFSNFFKISQIFPGGVQIGGRVHFGGVCRDTCLVFVVFGHM